MARSTYQADPLPSWAGVGEAIREALPNLRPLARVTVAETAVRRSIEDGGQWVPYRWNVAPYMAEPGNVVTSRRFDSVAFIGPARSSKSEGLIINPLVHAILAQPRTVAMFSPSKEAAQEWSMGALDPLILNSPELRALLLSGKGGDNVFGKRFRGGTRLTIDWPVKAKLAQRSIPLALLTDYDAMPDDVGGDGDPFSLARKRTESAGSRAMTVAESSPRKLIPRVDWKPQGPHEAPPCGGIVGLYNQGSRGRLYWTCRDCGEAFQPLYDRLHYPETGSPNERAAGAYMVAPCCGSVIEARHKAEFNLGGRWLHECNGGEIVPLEDLRRDVATASYWLPGPAAALASWSRIVARMLAAEATFAATGDEAALKTATNVELGLPYRSRAQGASEGLTAEALRGFKSSHPWQTCPAGTRFVTVAVDVQATRFVVQVEAWLSEMERVVIDRFDLFTPPEDVDGRGLDPAKYPEDWRVLDPLGDQTYPVEGGTHALRPLGVVIDMGGAAGVTPNARTFWRRMRQERPKRFHLVRGRGGDKAKRAHVSVPETAHRGKQHVQRDVPIVWAGTDRLKDEIAASLLRAEPGPRKLHLPAQAPDEVFEEYAAEERGAKGWEKRPGVNRNEALDLSVYALALAIVLEVEAVNWSNPPRWAEAGPGNSQAVPVGAAEGASDGGDPGSAPTAQDETPPPKQSSGWRVKRSKRPWA